MLRLAVGLCFTARVDPISASLQSAEANVLHSCLTPGATAFLSTWSAGTADSVPFRCCSDSVTSGVEAGMAGLTDFLAAILL